RNQMLKATTQLSNQIRGLMKTFGLVVPKGPGRVFEGHVRSLLASNAGLEQIILPVLEAWRGMRARAAELSKQLVASARASEQCQLLSSIPGINPKCGYRIAILPSRVMECGTKPVWPIWIERRASSPSMAVI